MDVIETDAAYAAYDWLNLDDWPDGSVVRFWAQRRQYAALWVAGGWFVTGGSSPNGVSTEDFVAWLIERDVPANTLEAL